MHLFKTFHASGEEIMQRLKTRLTSSLAAAIVYTLLGMASTAFAATAQPFTIKVILPGATETLDIAQTAAFPLGCPNFFIGVLGKGTLGISLLKSDRAGDTIFINGLAQSSQGTVPFFRLGVSIGMVGQTLEIGDDDEPYGFVWVYGGVAFSAADPPYSYQLRISLAP
jgi:hypothetical protein